MIAVTLNFMGRTALRHTGKKATKGYISLCKRFRKCLVCSPVAPGTLETFATLHTHMNPQPPLPVDAATPLKFLTVDDPVLNCSTDFLAPDSETVLSS